MNLPFLTEDPGKTLSPTSLQCKKLFSVQRLTAPLVQSFTHEVFWEMVKRSIVSVGVCVGEVLACAVVDNEPRLLVRK